MTVTALVGAQFGSEGKGVVAARLASRFDAAVRTGGPNAGHTFRHDGQTYKMRQIPCAWINPKCDLFLGAGAVIDPVLLVEEAKFTGRLPFIDRHAVVIDPEWRKMEEPLVETIGSTAEGVGLARMTKIGRNGTGNLAMAERWYKESSVDTVDMLWQRLQRNKRVLLEGTQGSGLSLHHGDYPFVTSTDTNAAQLLADAGIAPDWLQHTLLIARTFPIRVGGHSGPMFKELDWADIPGAPTPERTTVTNRIRRIGMWDDDLFTRAIQLNEPCGVALTFADYIDPHVRTNATHEWSDALWDLINRIERDVPVVLVGVGGADFQMVPWHRCAHGEEW